ncbi:MAG: hypothetical protein WCO61_02365 [Alphaproteobacteria bacterium]
MSRFKFVALGFASLIALSPVTAFALDDGRYHAVDVQPACGKLAAAVLYVEADKVISASVTSETYNAVNAKKITNAKMKMAYDNNGKIIEAELSKAKNNVIDVRIISAPNCAGSQIKFSK